MAKLLFVEIFDMLSHISFLIKSHSAAVIWASEWFFLRVNTQMSIEFAYAGEDFETRLGVLMITGAVVVLVVKFFVKKLGRNVQQFCLYHLPYHSISSLCLKLIFESGGLLLVLSISNAFVFAHYLGAAALIKSMSL